MTETVTMRVTVDPVLRDQIKLHGLERGLTLSELLPKLLSQGLGHQSAHINGGSAEGLSRIEHAPTDEENEIEETPPPEPSIQETMTALLANHAVGVNKAFSMIAAREERIEQICNQHNGRIEKAVEAIGKHTEQAVEQSNSEWRYMMQANRRDRYWLGGASLATLIAVWIIMALIAGTSVGRKIAIWQTGADTDWQAAMMLASNGSTLRAALMAETKALLENPDFQMRYAKCVERAKAAKVVVRCDLAFPALSPKS